MKLLSAYHGRQNRGCWKRLTRLLLTLANDGHTVELFTSQPAEGLAHPGIRVRVLSLSFVPNVLNDFYFFTASFVLSFFMALRGSLDRLLAFDGHNAFALAGARAARRDLELFLSVRGHPVMHTRFDNGGWSETLILHLANWVGYRLARNLVYNSNVTAESVDRFYKRDRSQSLVIPNDILLPEEDCHANCHYHTRRELGLSMGDFVVGFAGQFIDRKNIQYLIGAVRQMPVDTSLTLLLKGKGPLRAELEAQIEAAGLGARTQFLPWDEKMECFYRAIDVFVLPSLYDDCSNALLEALSFSCCVLASNKGGNPEILAGSHDLLFSLDDGGKELAGALQRLAMDAEWHERLRTKCEGLSAGLVFPWEKIMASLALGQRFESISLACRASTVTKTAMNKSFDLSR